MSKVRGKTSSQTSSRGKVKVKPKVTRASKGASRNGLAARSKSRITGMPNDQLLPDKDVTLNGAERFFIMRCIERTSHGQRTKMEHALMKKVAQNAK